MRETRHSKPAHWDNPEEWDGEAGERGFGMGDTCTPVFNAALFTIARTWKQPRCPSTDEWMRKLWYRYTMEHYSTI